NRPLLAVRGSLLQRFDLYRLRTAVKYSLFHAERHARNRYCERGGRPTEYCARTRRLLRRCNRSIEKQLQRQGQGILELPFFDTQFIDDVLLAGIWKVALAHLLDQRS